jgi:AraC-like DNA-binding protein
MPVSGSSLANRYDRAELGEGVLGWVYEYVNPQPVQKLDAMATGLELGVQLRGEWLHDGSRTGRGLYAPGSVHVISPSERYSLECCAKGGQTGLQVGFIVYPDEVRDLRAAGTDVAFRRGVESDRRLLELCRAYQVANDVGRPLPAEHVRAEVLRFVRAHLEAVPADPIVSAKREIERTFAQPLYLEHLAQAAGMPAPRFTRKFAARFGAPPIAYRLRLRLNEAARLTWSEPTLGLRAIAERVGFEDMPYFHRAFVREFGMTPALYGRRSLASAPGTTTARLTEGAGA